MTSATLMRRIAPSVRLGLLDILLTSEDFFGLNTTENVGLALKNNIGWRGF